MVISILNEELNKINIWLKANKLTLNLDKSHYMVFHRGKRKTELDSPSLNHISLKKVNILCRNIGLCIRCTFAPFNSSSKENC